LNAVLRTQGRLEPPEFDQTVGEMEWLCEEELPPSEQSLFEGFDSIDEDSSSS
jgi:hypothetical protein